MYLVHTYAEFSFFLDGNVRCVSVLRGFSIVLYSHWRQSDTTAHRELRGQVVSATLRGGALSFSTGK